MKKVYVITYNKALVRAADLSHEELFTLLRLKNPRSQYLAEDPQLYQLHELYALLRLGHIKLTHLFTDPKERILLEIWEQRRKRPFQGKSE